MSDDDRIVSVLWGRADDGVVVRIEVTSDTDEQPGDWWPVMGLEPVGKVDDPVTTIAVDCRSAIGWDRLESDLALFTAERLGGVVAVHAGVIRARHESRDVVIVLPGPSFAGKTTLCAAALDAGHEVLSDEYALVRPSDGLITGYPRRLRVRRPDGLSERRPATASAAPMAVDLVAVVTYGAVGSDEPSALQIETLSPGDVAMALLANTVCAQSRPEESFRAAVAMARRTKGVEGARGEADRALEELITLAGSSEAKARPGV